MVSDREPIVHSEQELYPTIRGVGTVVLNSRNQVLVGTELQDKDSNHRKKGQMSIPMETLKGIERNSEISLVRVALSEILGDSNMKRLSDGLREVGHGGPIALDAEGTQGAVVVFRWAEDPDEMPFVSAVPGEFSDLHWIDLDELRYAPNTRPYVHPFLDFAEGAGMLNGMPTSEISALRGHNPNSYLRFRDLYSDVR